MPIENKGNNNISEEQRSQYGQNLIKMAKEKNHAGIRKCWLESRSIELNKDDLNKAFLCVLQNYDNNKNEDMTSELRGALHNLLAMGADSNCEEEGLTALLSAVYKNDTKLVDLLSLYKVNMRHITQQGEGALNIAIYRNVDPHIIDKLLENKANVNHINPDDNGYTVLMWAILNKTTPALLEKILNLFGNNNDYINTVNGDGERALDILVKEKLSQSEFFGLHHKTCGYNIKVLSLLLTHQANIYDFVKLYEFLSKVYKKSEELFRKPALLNQSDAHVKEAFANLLICFESFCAQLQKKSATKGREAKGQSFGFESEAMEYLSRLKKVSNFLQQMSLVSSAQLNVFKEQSRKQKQHFKLLQSSLTPKHVTASRNKP